MNVMVIGAGAREHALAWKLRQSRVVDQLFIAQGNAGTRLAGTNLPVAVTDFPALLAAARRNRVDLVVVGPEIPLAAGIVDAFRREGMSIFGPTASAARIESSKAFSKELMLKHGIPTGRAKVFSQAAEAKRYVQSLTVPMVVKADGLAAGKGVTVCATRREAIAAIEDAMERRVFGASGDRVLVEECLTGREVSVFVFTDGEHVSAPVAACDYKRIFDGDQGPNTGGMGSYSPPEFWTEGLAERVMSTIVAPTVRAMAQEGCPFQGVLYTGLMLTPEGPKVIEYNCRLGDPEAQVLLPRLASDLAEVVLATVNGTLDRCEVRWSPMWCVGVVMASRGYPGDYPRGTPIHGLDTVPPGVTVFHAGTASRPDGATVTDGGRVLTVTALGETLESSRDRAYEGMRGIRFEGAQYRKDIASVRGPTAELRDRLRA